MAFYVPFQGCFCLSYNEALFGIYSGVVGVLNQNSVHFYANTVWMDLLPVDNL